MIICNARVAFEEPQFTIIFIDTVPVHPVNKATKIDTPYVARVSANVGEIALWNRSDCGRQMPDRAHGFVR